VLIRTFVVAFTVAALWWSSSSFGVGLGLGELKIDSNLAAPLKASVTLRGMSDIDLDPEQFSIRIDSESKSKIEYRLLRMDSDTAIIQLYTRDIISNPLFQFRVEVKWDSSTVSRTYDVLVDPPAYGENFRNVDETEIVDSVATVSAPSSGQIDEDPADNQNALQVKPAIALSDDGVSEAAAIEELEPVSVAVNVGAVNSQQQRKYGPTIDGNSIWRVARAVATDNPDLTIYQWMYAIWNSNPEAFTRNNMHRLKLKEVLDIPFEDQVAATSHSAAWRAYSEQMAVVQVASPVKPDDESATVVDGEQAVPAVAEIRKMDAQQIKLATDAQQPSNSGAAVINEFAPNARQESEVLAAGVTAIALLEESASTMDEEAVITREPGVSGTTAETSMPMDPLTADAPPAVALNGISSSAEVDSTNEIGGVAATRIELNEDPILLDALDAEMAGNSLSTAVDAAPLAASIQEMPEWSRALQERYDHINQLPVIGSDGALSFVGRSVQAADRFIATRPSWATLALGIWITLVLLMLRQEILSRRKTAVAASAAALPEALETNETAKQEKAGQDSVKVTEEEEQPVALPKAAPIPSNAPAIIAQANAILSRGDTEEAIKLMRLAVELQPGQPTLVIHLLELYHRTRNTELFSELVDRSCNVLEALDSRDQTRLEMMYAQLCPDTVFPLGRGEPVANHEMPVVDNADAESESVSGLVAEIGASSDVDAIDEVDTSIAVQEPELEKHAELGRQDPATLESGVPGNLDIDDNEDEEYIQTQVIFTNNGVPLREEATPMPGMVGEILDLEVTLKEADVYLAYGLYDNAEELLLKGMEVDPERADFLARLMDSYYATRNVVDFVACAEVMQDMGEAGADYWERVEIMGYELAPYNNLFADGKDKSLSPVELEFPKPETADFDFSDIDESGESAFTEIEIAQDGDSTLSESTFTDIKIDKYLDDNSEADDPDFKLKPETADFEFSESGESAVSDIEIIQDSESSHSESTITDIQIGKYLDDDSEPDDLNLDLESHELNDGGNNLLDGLISELDDLPETEESGMAEDDASLEINLDATADDFDMAFTVDVEAAEDELRAAIAGEVEDDDEVIDLNYGDEDAIQFTMDEDSLADDLKSEQSPPVDSDDASLVLVDDSTVDTLFGVKLDSDNSRILYFPDSPSEGKDIDEFESEVKMTLQAIRDQLQNMTERLFQQERTTNDLKQTISELKDDNLNVAKNNKKSS